MDSQPTNPLLNRFLSGQSLTLDEERQVHELLEARPEYRDEILRDEEIDSALVTMSRYEAEAEDFVAATLARLEQASAAEPQAPPLATKVPAIKTMAPRSSTRRLARTRERLIVLCATLLVVVTLGVIVGLMLSRAIHPVSEPSVTQNGDENSNELVPAPERGFAYVSDTSGVWASGQREGDRLETGLIELSGGESIIKFDKGTEAKVIGPAVLDLRSEDEVYLVSGDLRVLVPQPAIGFTVVTPMARVIDRGTEFEVSVASTGATQAKVHRGAVEFMPQRQGELPGKSIELTAAGLNQAISSIPSINAPALPVSTEIRGVEGRFIGMISSGGQTLEFDSAEDFFEHQQEVMRELQAAPLEFERVWAQMVRSGMAGFGASTSGATSGSSSRNVTVSINGQTVSISENSETGIKVVVSSLVDGENREMVYEAKNAEELKTKSLKAWELYQAYLGGEEK